MMKKIKIAIGSVEVIAELLNTPTAQAIADNLPFASKAQTWGEEVYFETPVMAELEAKAKDVVEAGELAFWVEGQCIAIGFGPTPISQGNEIRLAAKTNIWARALTDVRELKKTKPDDFVFIEIIE
ncbi:MAG: cyclophilin-like fold protein [Gammaproteobacteria bacterium]|nr:cyclophilin-like fold protein [Gammaproteobacteria bacterium]